MSQTATITQFTPETALENHRKGFETRGKLSKRNLLKHAVEIEELAHKAATDMREIIEDDSPVTREDIRADRQALAAIVRAWDIAIDRIRKLRGEPDPGSYKHEVKVANKPKKTKPANRPPSFKQPPAAPVQPVPPADPAPGPDSSQH